jgi:hypothetical protein
MPYEYSIDPEKNLLRETVTGKVTTEGLREFALRQARDPLYRRGLRLVSDYTRAQAEISYQEMSDFVRWLSTNVHHTRQAIVVTRQLEFALARMFEQLSEGEDAKRRGRLRVFRDLAAAEAWALGNDDSEAA